MSKKTSIQVPQDQNKKLIKGENGILFPCTEFYLLVTEFQMEGKRRMSFDEFIAGNSIDNLELID